MNQYNNKDLYQITGVRKNASQQEDDNLTNEQKGIKEFFQQVKEQGGETYFNAKELEQAINKEKSGGKEQQGNDKN